MRRGTRPDHIARHADMPFVVLAARGRSRNREQAPQEQDFTRKPFHDRSFTAVTGALCYPVRRRRSRGFRGLAVHGARTFRSRESMAREIQVQSHTPLADYEALGHLAGAVAQLRTDARALVPHIGGRTVWMVNSTATGGGVAEMLPNVVALLRELGVDARWAVIDPERTDFFALTKNIHNMLHDAGPGAYEARTWSAERVRWQLSGRSA